MKNDIFTLWGVQDESDGHIRTYRSRSEARNFRCGGENVVKLSCQIVPQKKAKPKKYNFGLPAGMTPHNPDNLTPEQVGKGFRLLAREEIWARNRGPRKNVFLWNSYRWIEEACAASEKITYRVPADWPLDINPKLKGQTK